MLTEPASSSPEATSEASPSNDGGSRRDGPSTPAAAPAAGSEQGRRDGEGSDLPVWPWVLGAVVLAGAGGAVALRLGRR